MGISHRLRRGCRFLWKLALSAALLACGPLWADPDTAAVSHVQLNCKIVPSHQSTRSGPWVVELRKANGDPLFQALKVTGDTIKIKDLDAGIYQLCILSSAAERCQSVDLIPPPSKKSFTFKMRIATPEGGAGGFAGRAVSVVELSIPKDARQEMSRSEQAELSGDSKEALRHLERALALDPDYPDALNNMGVYCYRTQDYARSAAYLTKAIQIEPGFYVAWANLGSSLLADGKFQEALKVSRQAYELRPNDARSNYQLGLTWYYLRNYAEATKYLQKAASLDPLSAGSPQLFLAEIAILQKNQGDAEYYISDFLKRHPNSSLGSRLKEVLTEVRSMHFVAVPALDINSVR